MTITRGYFWYGILKLPGGKFVEEVEGSWGNGWLGGPFQLERNKEVSLGTRPFGYCQDFGITFGFRHSSGSGINSLSFHFLFFSFNPVSDIVIPNLDPSYIPSHIPTSRVMLTRDGLRSEVTTPLDFIQLNAIS